MSQTFGQYTSFAKFVESYEAARQKEEQELERGLSMAERRERRRRLRDVVEVDATIRDREPDDNDLDGGKHYRLLVTLTKIVKSDPDVDGDLKRNLSDREDVFVAIRFGDRMGIIEPIEGLNDGAILNLRGEWITKEKARQHGGRFLSVLHFTHHPIGFVCTANKCYS